MFAVGNHGELSGPANAVKNCIEARVLVIGTWSGQLPRQHLTLAVE